ncbi:MAG: hypothetical protein IJ246_04975 [Clostridia bacterium]|nr:hypothetical protein [Clostridia bacterium]
MKKYVMILCLLVSMLTLMLVPSLAEEANTSTSSVMQEQGKEIRGPMADRKNSQQGTMNQNRPNEMPRQSDNGQKQMPSQNMQSGKGKEMMPPQMGKGQMPQQGTQNQNEQGQMPQQGTQNQNGQGRNAQRQNRQPQKSAQNGQVPMPEQAPGMDALVKDGTISEETARAIDEFMQSQTPPQENEQGKDLFETLLENGVITQEEFDAISSSTQRQSFTGFPLPEGDMQPDSIQELARAGKISDGTAMIIDNFLRANPELENSEEGTVNKEKVLDFLLENKMITADEYAALKDSAFLSDKTVVEETDGNA